jgi:hypothetical protein
MTARFCAVTAVAEVVEPVVLAEPDVPLVAEPVVPPPVVPELVPEVDVPVLEAELELVCPVVVPPVVVPVVVLATGGPPEHAWQKRKADESAVARGCLKEG